MYSRTITIEDRPYDVTFPAALEYRITIKDGVAVASESTSNIRTDGAEFEAVFFDAVKRANILAGPEQVDMILVDWSAEEPKGTDEECGPKELRYEVVRTPLYEIGPVVVMPSTLDEAKTAKKTEIAAARWQEEIGGVAVQDMHIDTSREGQALIVGAALQAMLDSSYTCRWKAENGFVEFSAETILLVASAVRQHIQACFDREAAKIAEIDAASTAEAVVAIFW